MANISTEKKREEAVKRMKMIGIFPETIKQFERGEYLSQSEPPFGACFWVEGEQLERVREFEQKYNALVYFIIHSYSNIGETEEYFYVSDYEDEWQMDRDMLDRNLTMAYVYVKDNPLFSEFGSIGYRTTPAAGLERIS